MADALLTRGVEIKEEMFGPEHGQTSSTARPISRASSRSSSPGTASPRCGAARAAATEHPQHDHDRDARRLGQSHEIRVHVQGAINNGVTKDQIREILIHAASTAGSRLLWTGSGTPRGARRAEAGMA